MSIATLIIGESGSGKSTSLRNLIPEDVLLIQSIRKPLPFRAKNWKVCDKDNPTGSVLVTDKSASIVAAMQRTSKPIIVLDDFQYILANEYMRRSEERGYEKFSDIGKNAWNILSQASELGDTKRVYILAHSQTDDYGKTKCKTIGRMLDEKITVEGLFTIVMRSGVQDGQHFFNTRNSGADTVKTPMGLFDTDRIDNCLKSVDEKVCEFFEVTTGV